MAGRTCGLPGCSKPCVDPHLACGEVHHLLLMVSRYNPSLPHPPHQLILDRNSSGLCALPSCSRSPWPGHAWCGRTHYLSWLSDFYDKLLPQQICKLPDCTRHVFVEDTADGPHPSQFCGWRHRQKYVMRTAIELQHQQPPSSQRGDHGHVPSVKSLMHTLKHFTLHGDDPNSIEVDKDFFTKHPWEVLTEGTSCMLIAQCKFTWKRKKKQREMVTKDHFHWKQQGPPKDKSGYSRKYFTYRKLRGKKEEVVQHSDEKLYTMKEYSIDASKLYCLVKLRKASCKQRKREVNVGLSEDSALPKLEHASCRLLHSLEGNFPVDSFYEELPSITELSYDDLP